MNIKIFFNEKTGIISIEAIELHELEFSAINKTVSRI